MSEDSPVSPSITKHIEDTIFTQKYRFTEIIRVIEKLDGVEDNGLASDEEIKELEDLEKKIRDHEGHFKGELEELEDAKNKDICFLAIVLPLPIFGMFIFDFNLFQYEKIPDCLHILYSGPVIFLVYATASLIYLTCSKSAQNEKNSKKPENTEKSTDPDIIDDWEHTITIADIRHRQLEILKYFKNLRCDILKLKYWIIFLNFCGHLLLIFAATLRIFNIQYRIETELESYNTRFFLGLGTCSFLSSIILLINFNKKR